MWIWVLTLWSPIVMANPRTHVCSSLTESPDHQEATYVGSDGVLHISEKADLFAGQAVDTGKFRAPTLLRMDTDYVWVKNFMHEGKFYIAKISRFHVKEARVQTMPFPIAPGVMAGHVQIRFLMEEGHEIELLDDAGEVRKGVVSDLIVSYEAALPVGGTYNFAFGVLKANPLVGRLVSGQQKLYEGGPDRAILQYRLPLTGEEKSELLEYFLKDSHTIGMKYFYNTIVRNCTTSIFDGIDTLPRIRKLGLGQFLTHLGGDPVIGPALVALLDRFGDDLVQVQDMRDEARGVRSESTPSRPKSDRLAFAPGGEHPMSLVMVEGGTEHLTESQRMAFQQLQAEIRDSLPESLNIIFGAAFAASGGDLQKMPDLLKAMMKALSARLEQRVKRFQEMLGQTGGLPEVPVTLQWFYTPYPSSGGLSLSRMSRPLRAHIPIGLQQGSLGDANLVAQIEQGVSEVDARVSSETPIFLRSALVRLMVGQNQQTADTQLLLGVQGMTHPFHEADVQVEISEVVIPERRERGWWESLRSWWSEPETPVKESVSVLVSHHQILGQDAIPRVRLQFGGRPRLQIGDGTQGLWGLSTPGRFLCWGSEPYAPELRGRLVTLFDQNGSLSWFNELFRGDRVAFALSEMDLSFEVPVEGGATRVTVDRMDVRVGVWGFRCISVDSVNERFKDKAQSALNSIMEKWGPPAFALP